MFFFVVFIASIILMFKSSEQIIKHSLILSRLLGISTFVIGFILVSVSTSLPEFFVIIFSTMQNEVNLSVGTIFGSNLTDLTIILGLASIFGGTIYLRQHETLILIELLFITSLVTIFIFQLSSLSIVHGLILLVLFGYLIGKLYKGGRVGKEIYDHIKESRIKAFGKFAISVILLVIASYFLVDSAIQIADFFALTTTFIGATIVALGTSLPELSVELVAVKKKEYSLAMGDLLGSSVTNITLVLGILSIVNPVAIDVASLSGILPFSMISILLIWYTFNKRGKVTKHEGFVLLLLYAIFILEQLGITGIFR